MGWFFLGLLVYCIHMQTLFLSLFFGVYLLFCGLMAGRLLKRFFGLANFWQTTILGILLSFTTLGWFLGIVVLFDNLSNPVILLCFLVNGLLWLIVEYFLNRRVGVMSTPVIDKEQEGGGNTFLTWFGVVIYLFFILYSLFLLYFSKSDASILTPWKTISYLYIYAFFIATLILGWLIFFKLRPGIIILLLIIHSFLLYSYLPLTQSLLYGGDQWRHIGYEERLMGGKPFFYAQAQSEGELVSGDISSKTNLRSIIPNLSLMVGKLSYGNFWGIAVVLAKIFNVSLLQINKWLGPILFAIFLPILLYQIGLALGWAPPGGSARRGSRSSLLLVWLGFLPFALQAGGAFTLPVNFGFLSWLLLFLLILQRIKEKKHGQVLILSILGMGLVFGYVLYFILFWLVFGLCELSCKLKVVSFKFLVLVIVGVAALIPVIELVAGYSVVPFKFNWLGQLKQILGNFIGWYLATGPRPHDITTGNILFNQAPLASYVSNFFTGWLGVVVIFSLLFFSLVVYGIKKMWKDNKETAFFLLSITGGLFGSYVISRYFLGGDNILSRRLDVVLAFLFIILFAYGLNYLLLNFKLSKILLASFLLVCSVAITASYSFGPDTNSVSANEYKAMQYVWQNDQGNSNHCVIAQTFPLLALEAISSKEITGGGFPIEQSYSQPELIWLLNKTLNEYNDKILKSALGYTKASKCYWVGQNIAYELPLFSNKKVFGKVAVLEYNIR